MAHFALMIASLALFVGFVVLTIVETRFRFRVLGGARVHFDQFSNRLFIIVRHVNWSEFVSHLVRSFVARAAHDTAYASLALVRFAERQLTRTVRYLRNRRPNVLAPRASRESVFSQASSYIQRKRKSKPE
jgi:hypothetical protein